MSSACQFIPFTLGNGLPSSNPAAIPNSLNGVPSYGPLLITQSGNYVLQNSPQMQITGATPTHPNALIIVEASYVKINLCGNVLTGSGNLTAAYYINNGTPTPNISTGITNDTRVDSSVGILVNPNLTNVEIYNGTLQYFSIAGISASSDIDVYLHDLLVQHCSTVTLITAGGPSTSHAGILLTGVSNSKVDNITFQSNIYSDLFLSSCTSTHVSNTSSDGLRGGAFEGLQLDNADFVNIGVQAIPTQSRSTSGSSGQSFKNIKINNVQTLSAALCIFITGTPPGSDNVGPLGVVIEDCLISNITTPVTNTSFLTSQGTNELRGIAVETLSGYATVKNCQVSGIINTITMGTGSTNYSPPGWNSITGFNIEGVGGILLENCQATNIKTAGWVAANWPGISGQTFPNPYPIAGFVVSGDTQDVTLVGCFASNIDGGSTSTQPTTATGFFVQAHYVDHFNQNSATLRNCIAKFVQGCSGSADFLVNDYANYLDDNYTPELPVTTSLKFENCVGTNDYIDAPTLAGSSSGFAVRQATQNVIFENCESQGHSQYGFFLDNAYTYQQDAPIFRGVIYNNCTAQGNNLSGFYLDRPFNQVSVNNSISNNNQNGYEVLTHQVIFNNSIAEFNRNDGFLVKPYFQWQVEAVTNTSLSNLNIYPSGYTVVYGTNNITLVPTNPTDPFPPFLPIGGVDVYPGAAPNFTDAPLILVTDEPNPVNNGVYAVNVIYTTIDNTSVIEYILIRVGPWLVGNTVAACTRILYVNASVDAFKQYVLENTIVVGTDAPIFGVTNKIKADSSDVIIRNPVSLLNGCKDIKVSKEARNVRVIGADECKHKK